MRVDRFELPLPRPYAIPTDGQTVQPRSEGIHLSAIRDSIARKIGKLPKAGIDEPACFDLMAHIGIAWENYLAKLIMHDPPEGVTYDFHPGELTRDGIAMNPDMIEYRADLLLPVLHEVKTKWMRPPKDEEFEKKHWRDIVQTKAYCYDIDTTYAYLHVLYIVWWPTGMPTPVFVTYRLEFEQEELESNWRMLQEEHELMKNQREKI